MSNLTRTRRQVNPAIVYKRWGDWSQGDYIIGEYLGTKIDPTYNKEVYMVKLETVSLSSPVTSQGGGIKEGMTIGLNHCGGLAVRMSEVKIGDCIELIYNGTEELPSGHKYKGKDAHQFEVYILGDEEENSEEDCL